ncbi:MAG: septum formation initiator family protein [Patescibacteria group bacterium]|nr:septum formation initiator family protein [Patescibacteria group bacterium]
MLEFKKRQNIKKRIYSPLVVFVLFVILVFGFDSVWGIYKKKQMSDNNLVLTQQGFDKLKNRYDTLKEEVDRLNTQEGIEEEIRNKFSVVKEGEQVAIIVESTNKATTTLEFLKTETLWDKIVGWFK